jgi:hypothetical protein
VSDTPRQAFARLLEALDRLEIRSMVSGSVASSIHGHARMTRDVDIIVDIGLDDAGPLVDELTDKFYIDADGIRSAIEHQRSFNVIHLQSSFKFDLFPLSNDPYQQAQFNRRRFEISSLFGADPLEFAVASPEDLILGKLRWYQLGGGVSEHQWNDVLGVMAVQRERLDLDYLFTWAGYLEISHLLRQALAEHKQ